LGGETVSKADSSGRKIKTYVRAEGATLAWQTVYHGSNPPSEYVNLEHFDAGGLSYRSATKEGYDIYGEGGEGSPAELDPLGGNVGLSTPYIEPVPGSKNEFLPVNACRFAFVLTNFKNGQKLANR
jgi:hypothetical protein